MPPRQLPRAAAEDEATALNVAEPEKGFEEEPEFWGEEYKPLTTALLAFTDPAIEADFRLDASRSRLDGRKWISLDAALFLNNLLVMAVAPRRFRRAGLDGEVAPVVAAGALYFVVTALYLYRGCNTAIRSFNMRWRLAFHVCAYLLATGLFARHNELPNMCLTCSVLPGLKDSEPVELMAAYLTWLTTYALLANMPLCLALPCHLVSVAMLFPNGNYAPCIQNVKPLCHATYSHYAGMNRWLLRATRGLALGAASPHELAQGAPACSVVISCLKLFIFVILSNYVAFYWELFTRQAWAVQTRRLRLADDLRWRRPKVWQLAGEALLACAVLFQACSTAQLWVGLLKPGWGQV